MAAARILLVYHSDEGQTEKVAHRIEEVFERHGARVSCLDVSNAPPPVGHELVVLGDSIHVGSHSKELERYLRTHRQQLAAQPLAMFQVSMTSSYDDEEHDTLAHDMFHDLASDTGVDPAMVGLFAGALAYTRYGWFKRKLMQRIASSEGGDTDTSVDHEYTDWEAVEQFALDALSLAGVDTD